MKHLIWAVLCGCFSLANAQPPSDVPACTYDTTPFAQWPIREKKLLNLFETFEPKIPLVMYVAKTSFLVDRKATDLPVDQLMSVDAIEKLDTSVKQDRLSP